VAVPDGVQRLVVPVGSGMTLAGLLWGLWDLGLYHLPVVGVIVGADPEDRLDRWAPPAWRLMDLSFRMSPLGYHSEAPAEWAEDLGLPLDPVYEAKCIPFLEEGDALWIVGRRGVER
jgi:1-aminocyclopropane-1-carboxylate deaminase/D-cysteine desulfhydrase-like pyridoxal-dependent ACC family enzyme